MSRPMQREVSVASSQQGLTIEDAYKARQSPDTDSSSGTTSESWATPRPVKFSRGGCCGTGVIFTARTMLAAAFALAILGFSFLGLAAYLLIRSPHKTSHLGSPDLVNQPELDFYIDNTTVTNKSNIPIDSWNNHSKLSNRSSTSNEQSIRKSINTISSSTDHAPHRILDHVHGRHPGGKARHHPEAIMADAPWADTETVTKGHRRPASTTIPPRSFIGRLWDFVSIYNNNDDSGGSNDEAV